MQRIGTIKATAFTKTSQEGKEYKQVAFTKADKQLDGTYKETTMFMFAGDVANAIAVLQATLPELTYQAPKEKTEQPAKSSADSDLNDGIPF